MAKDNLISGVTNINGSKYIIIRRFNNLLMMILGIIIAIIGSFKLSTTFGAFLFGAGLAAFLISIEQVGNAMIGYKKRN